MPPLPGKPPLLRLFIQCGLPLAVGGSLTWVMTKAFGTSVSLPGLSLLLGGIASAYTVDRLIDANHLMRVGSPEKIRGLALAILPFLGFTFFAMLQVERSIQISAFVLGLITLAYTRLKRFPLIKTAIIALAWTWACATLPFAGTGIPQNWWTLKVVPPLLLLIAGNGILCDLKDLKQDLENSIPTLPVLLGSRETCRVVTGLLLLSVALAVNQDDLGIAIPGASLALAAQFPTVMESEIAGPLIADGILILPGILIYLGVT